MDGATTSSRDEVTVRGCPKCGCLLPRAASECPRCVVLLWKARRAEPGPSVASGEDGPWLESREETPWEASEEERVSRIERCRALLSATLSSPRFWPTGMLAIQAIAALAMWIGGTPEPPLPGRKDLDAHLAALVTSVLCAVIHSLTYASWFPSVLTGLSFSPGFRYPSEGEEMVAVRFLRALVFLAVLFLTVAMLM
ncbi:MAG: hypothetical protein HYV63_12885 [Candidatus Schekmanbacteria bacterium]|nr:hypothetical protein [Candidatus Schekmanbacteria bacterium]